MRILLFITIFSCCVCHSTAQIKMAQFPIKQDTVSIFPYDSLTNIRPMSKVERGKKYNHLIGQKIMSVYSEGAYGRFDILDKNGRSIRYGLLEKLSDLDGNIYIIDSISTHSDVLFHLRSENFDSIIKVVWEDAGNSVADEVWVCLGYYEKIKQLYLGKELVYVWDDYGWSDGFIDNPNWTHRFMDYETSYNLAKKIPCNTIWTCTDVMVLPVLPQERESRIHPHRKQNRVILNIENQEYGKYYIFADHLLSTQNHFMTLEQFNAHKAIQNQKYAEAKARAEAEAKKRAEWRAKQLQKLIDKYGEDIGYRIHNGEIWIGMTSTQCSESIGSPQRINRTTTMRGSREQWIYHSRYLYFENGILVTIQD